MPSNWRYDVELTELFMFFEYIPYALDVVSINNLSSAGY